MSTGPDAREARTNQVDVEELVELCALNPQLFCTTFFPKTFRQDFPVFDQDVWRLLESHKYQFVALKMFRGSAKTTRLRTFTLKRAVYGISRTCIFVSVSQRHSIQSVRWIKKQVEENELLRSVYGVEPGSKWTDEWIEIYSRALQQSCAIVALGITGQTRGLNIDDYRPDLIVVDDPCDEENTASDEQRERTEERFFSALAQSLAPRTECPEAMMVLSQTPFIDGDLVSQCEKDPTWANRSYGCFLPNGESSWPSRFPTETLLAEKQAHVARGQVMLWMREKEVTIIADELMDFKPSWARFWDNLDPQAQLVTFIGIDPVPPPSGRQIAEMFSKKDFEVLAVVGLYRGMFFVLEIQRNRGHQPDWTENTFINLVQKWKPTSCRVEANNYQRTLQYLLERKMRETRVFVPINPVTEMRKKRHRIVQTLAQVASQGAFYMHATQVELISQFSRYPLVDHDDDLDAVAMAVEEGLEYYRKGVEWDEDGKLQLYQHDQMDWSSGIQTAP